MIFLHKNNYLKDSIKDLSESFKQINLKYLEFINSITDEFDSQKEKQFCDEISEFESLIDSKIHNLEEHLYKDSLLPEFREDIFQLLEETDNISDIIEDIVKFFYTHNIKYPIVIKEDCDKVHAINSKAIELVSAGLIDLFEKNSEQIIKPIIDEISKLESEVDIYEKQMIRTLFLSDLSDLEKIVYSDFIKLLASLSDTCDNVSDIMKIILIKRVV